MESGYQHQLDVEKDERGVKAALARMPFIVITHHLSCGVIKEEAMQSDIVARLRCVVKDKDQGRIHKLIIMIRRTHLSSECQDPLPAEAH